VHGSKKQAACQEQRPPGRYLFFTMLHGSRDWTVQLKPVVLHHGRAFRSCTQSRDAPGMTPGNPADKVTAMADSAVV